MRERDRQRDRDRQTDSTSRGYLVLTQLDSLLLCACFSTASAVSASVSSVDGESGNPVGELQELTQKNLWAPPVYDFTSEQGPPHAREFVCTVKLGRLSEQGSNTIVVILLKC